MIPNRKCEHLELKNKLFLHLVKSKNWKSNILFIDPYVLYGMIEWENNGVHIFSYQARTYERLMSGEKGLTYNYILFSYEYDYINYQDFIKDFYNIKELTIEEIRALCVREGIEHEGF